MFVFGHLGVDLTQRLESPIYRCSLFFFALVEFWSYKKVFIAYMSCK